MRSDRRVNLMKIVSIFNGIASRISQSERLTASGVMWRAVGAARRPDAV
jgi:hypothetical protein